VAWVRGLRVEARVGHASTLGPVRLIGSANKGLPPVVTVAIDRAGNTLAAWLGPSDIHLAYRQAGFGFEPPRGLPHEPGAGFGGRMALTFSSNEHALLAVDGSNAEGSGVFAFDVFQGVASPAVRLAPPAPMGTPGPRLQGVTAGPRGQVAVWWAALRNGTGYTGVGDMVLSYRDAGGTFSAPEQVSTGSLPLADSSGSAVSTVRFDPLSGSPVALWLADLSYRRRLRPGQVVETSTRH
jgi:hypothetical protein